MVRRAAGKLCMYVCLSVTLHCITLNYFKCPKLIETAKAPGLSMLSNTSHAGKETENKYEKKMKSAMI